MTNQQLYTKRLYKKLASMPNCISHDFNVFDGYTSFTLRMNTEKYGLFTIRLNDSKSALYSLHCQFDNVENLPFYANPYSGKWNHYITARLCKVNDAIIDMYNTIERVSQ